MVAYSDVPAVNVLYQEQEQIAAAIAMIDDGGKVTNFTVSPKPPDVAAMTPGIMYMPVMIATADPSPDLMAQARAALVARQSAIVAELTALGVTAGPAAMSAQRAPAPRANQPNGERAKR